MDEKIKFKEKVSYTLLNIGNIPVTMIVSSFLLIFYTNVVGLSPASCATLFLISRIVDAVNDPFVGFLIDRVPNTKMGHFRLTLVIGAVLCGMNYLLLWFGPLIAPAGKLAIAYISYLLLGVLFPVMDISLNSLLPVMTENPKERNSLSTIKGMTYSLAGLVLGIAAPILIGDESKADGYIKLIILVAALIIGCSVLGAFGVKERVQAAPDQKYALKDLAGILTQKPVWTFFTANLLFGVANYVIMTVNTYYYVYVMGDLQLFSIASLLSMAGMLPGIAISGKLADKIGKKGAYIAGLVCFGILPLIRLAGTANVPIVFASVVLMNFGMGMLTPHMYGIQADNTDYVEIKSGFRAEAAVASLSSFVSKFSMGVGGAIPGYLLGLVGFNPAAEVQNDAVITMIIFCAVLLPAIITAIAAIGMKFLYPLDKQAVLEQTEEIRKLHNEGAANPSGIRTVSRRTGF